VITSVKDSSQIQSARSVVLSEVLSEKFFTVTFRL